MKSKFLVAAVSAALGIASVPAHASALAVADLSISQFFLTDANGNPVTSGFNIRTDSRTGTASSDYNGVQGTGIGNSNITGNFGPVDVKVRTAGPDAGNISGIYGGVVENNTTTHLLAPTHNFALGDMNISGTALATGGASGLTRANASATGPTNVGGANSTILNNVTAITTFSVNTNVTVALAIVADVFRLAFTSVSGNESASASATTSFSVTIDDLSDALPPILNWTPTQLNGGAASFDGLNTPNFGFAGLLLSEFRTLVSGHIYTLTVNQASNAQINDIPEPASLALVGLGLLGFGALRRRRAA